LKPPVTLGLKEVLYGASVSTTFDRIPYVRRRLKPSSAQLYVECPESDESDESNTNQRSACCLFRGSNPNKLAESDKSDRSGTKNDVSDCSTVGLPTRSALAPAPNSPRQAGIDIIDLMPRSFLLLFAAGATVSWGFQQPLTAQEDRQKMMDLLHITSLRQGANGSNPQAPNAANYDESKANPYPHLPDPLVMKNGKKVTSAEQWWNQRRPEIVEEFDREIYGRVPKNVPKVKWEVAETSSATNGDVAVVTKQLVGHVDNSSYPQVSVDLRVTLTTPANASGPVPVIMELGPGPRPAGAAQKQAPPKAASAGASSQQPWQQQVLAKGWGYAEFSTNSVQADNGQGLRQGIIGLVNKGEPRKPDDWGALRAWAWGASRALDYFESDKSVDAKRVGLEGHSRWGKAIAVAMAYDSRFAVAFVSSSGEGGVKIHRRNWGELVENVAAANEYHWMAGNFLKYAGPLNWDDLPVDSHELVALSAPRAMFISAGATNGDGWVDAKGSFLAAAGAGPVYKLLGKRDLGTTEFPPIETALTEGDVAFRQHSGGHTPGPNWPTFLTFSERYLKR
jgi:hypothetical protein